MVNTRLINSMTGSASADGKAEGLAFTWDIRSVNSKGCDIRLRVPDWIDGLDAEVRKRAGAKFARGSITISLKLGTRDSDENAALDPVKLDTITTALATIASHCAQAGLPTRPVSPAEIYALPEVMTGDAGVDVAAFRTGVLAALEPVLDDFDQSRAQEGQALQKILQDNLGEIGALAAKARAALGPRAERQAAALRAALGRLTSETEIEPQRLAQELALVAIKSDVAEELDRLDAHVAAASKLLSTGGVIGRRFDFLMQEFNREANTLCSKSQDAQLTEIGLDLKTVIDRIREQVQNVE